MTGESINYSFKRFVFSRIKSEKKGILVHIHLLEYACIVIAI